MLPTRPPFVAVVRTAAHHLLSHPASMAPALALLLPTLVLQLAAPTYLRTRLTPALWTVAVGSVLLIWLAQVATPAVCSWVHARRTGTAPLPPADLARISFVVGTCVTLGLALAVLPGLWLQARYALATLPSAPEARKSIVAMRRSAAETRLALVPLMLLAVVTLVGSALGQSAVAALAEWMGTLVPTAQISGRTHFELNYAPHVVTSLLAYLCSAAALTLYAVGVSVASDFMRGQSVPALAGQGERALGMTAGRFASAIAALVVALAAAFHKVAQHLP